MGTYDTRGGAARAPDLSGGDPSDLQEAVLSLLERAGIPTHINDQISKLIEEGEEWLARSARAYPWQLWDNVRQGGFLFFHDHPDGRCIRLAGYPGSESEDAALQKFAKEFPQHILPF